MVFYKCEKCNKEFNQKSNYIVHINRKKSCIIINDDTDNNTLIYKCEKCNKEFTKKYNYSLHINKNNPCNSKDLIKENKILLNKIKKLEKNQTNNIQLENKIILLEEENKKINELYNNLLDKCIKNNNIITNNNTNTVNNKTIKTNNTTNNNTTNNTINNINVKLVPFGMENLDDLTLEEKTNILNSGLLCSVVCTKKINCNPRLPQYHNISFTNLRSNDAKIYDKDKTWRTVDKEDLFESVILRRIDDVNNIIENEEIKISPYMDTLVKKGIDEDEVVKNTKIKKRFHRTVYDFDKNKDKNKLT